MIVKNVEVVELIAVTVAVGCGTEDDPYRLITEYWDKNGYRVFVVDPGEGG
ncbi:MAG: hypothetical protein E7K64_01600 [Clostridia bacterium]|nr:hypothetical protein [Clostridiales bacterium]MDU7471280.1 hypothetical protein [Serratia marcescens]MDU7504726.1 hypothetical protein [Clostridia bacterium]